MKKILLILFVATTMTSCYESVLNYTNHPTEGKVVLVLDEPTYQEDVEAPDSYTATLFGQEITLTDGVLEFPETIEPGEYTIYVYNQPYGVEVADNSLEATASVIASVDVTDGVMLELPDYFYFGYQDIVVTKDAVITSTVEINQISRDLHFSLTLTGSAIQRIVGISATLSGVAQQWSCIDDVPYGTPYTIEPTLTQITTGDVSILSGSLRLLGIHPTETQQLEITLTYEDNNPTTHVVVSDISSLLSTFNDDKSTPLTLIGDVETPSATVQDGTITNWEVVTDDPITVK